MNKIELKFANVFMFSFKDPRSKDKNRKCFFTCQLTNYVFFSFFCNVSACYKEPAPPVCPIPCPSACAPTCYSSCCQQGYQQTFYIPPPPPPPPIPPLLALPAPCPAPCPPTCAAAGCSPACCNTMYRQQPHVNYGKRHRTPKPAKGDKKHHISLKRHRKN